MTWWFAFKNLFRNRRRTVATGLAIIVGYTGLVLLGGYIIRIEKSLSTQAVYLMFKGHISIYKNDGLERYATKPSRYQLAPDDVQKLQDYLKKYQDSVDWIGSVLTGVGLVGNGVKSTPFSLLAVDARSIQNVRKNEMVKKWTPDFQTPEDLRFAETIATQSSAISITPRLGELINIKTPYENLSEDEKSLQLAGKSIYGDLNAANAELAASHTTGIEFLESSSMFGTLALAQELYQTDGVQNLIIYLKPGTDIEKLVTQMNKDFSEQQFAYKAYPFSHQDISSNYVGSMGFLYAMAGFFVFLICGAVVLSILNSLTMGILERTREIGTLRSIGFKRHQISWMLTQESLCLASLGCLSGTILAIMVSVFVNMANFRFTPPGAPQSIQFLLTPEINLFLIIYVIFLSITGIASYIMSYVKMNSKIVELLGDSGA